MNLDGVDIKEEIIEIASLEFGKELSDDLITQISSKVGMILEMSTEGKLSDIIKKQIEILLENEKTLEDFKSGYFGALLLYKKISGKDDVDFYSFNLDNPSKLIKYISTRTNGKYLYFFPSLINKFRKLIELFGEPIKEGTIAYKKSGETSIIKRITKDGSIILEGEKGSFNYKGFHTKEEADKLVLEKNNNLENN